MLMRVLCIVVYSNHVRGPGRVLREAHVRGEGNRQALRTQGDYVLLGLGVTGLEDKDPTFQPRGMGGMRSRWPREADGALCKGSSPHAWSR